MRTTIRAAAGGDPRYSRDPYPPQDDRPYPRQQARSVADEELMTPPDRPEPPGSVGNLPAGTSSRATVPDGPQGASGTIPREQQAKGGSPQTP
jgi:hypothetical protein